MVGLIKGFPVALIDKAHKLGRAAGPVRHRAAKAAGVFEAGGGAGP